MSQATRALGNVLCCRWKLCKMPLRNGATKAWDIAFRLTKQVALYLLQRGQGMLESTQLSRR